MSHLKICVSVVAELTTAIAKVTEDKKVTFGEILGLAPEILRIPSFVANLLPAIEELKNGITPEYQIEIEREVAKRLDLRNDNTEEIVEACINWIVLTSSTILTIVRKSKELK
jgi:hypothetical protein